MAAAAGDRRRDRPARGRRRTEPAADARRPSALFLRHRDGLPWRTGAHPPGGEISHRLLCRAVVRRHGRRPVRRPDRALHVLMDRGIPDPARAWQRCAGRPAATSVLPRWSRWYWPFLAVLAVALIAPSWSATARSVHWLDDHRVWIDRRGRRALGRCLRSGSTPTAGRSSRTVVVALVLIRAYPADDGRVETVRSFFGVHKIVVTPHGQYHVLMHGTTIHGAREIPERRRHAGHQAGPSRSPTTTRMAASGRRSRRCASARARRCASR